MSASPPTRLHRLMPPPVVLVLMAALMGLTARYPGWVLPAMPGQALVAAIIASAGLLVIVWAVLCFHRAQTTVNPIAPDQASALVTTGPYRFSRNPMYVGDVLLLLGWALFLGTPVNLLWIALFVGWLQRLQIPREEAALAEHFGRDYEFYCTRVRRWL